MTVIRTYTATDDCGKQHVSYTDNYHPRHHGTHLYVDARCDIYSVRSRRRYAGGTIRGGVRQLRHRRDLECRRTILVDTPNELTVERVYTASMLAAIRQRLRRQQHWSCKCWDVPILQLVTTMSTPMKTTILLLPIVRLRLRWKLHQ